MHHDNRRAAPRHAISLDVYVETLNQHLTLQSRDISSGGIFLFTGQEAPLNETVVLKLSTEERTGRVRGTVVHALPDVGFGVRFDDWLEGEGFVEHILPGV